VLCAITLCLVACGQGPDEGGSQGPVAVTASMDPRVIDLLEGCDSSSFYNRDTSDMLSVMMEKLRVGLADPQHRAKEELAAWGSEAIPELSRLFDKSYGNMMLSFADLKNCVDVLGMSTAEEAHDLLLRAAMHPHETVVLSALTGLGLGDGGQEDYEFFRGRIDYGTPRVREAFAQALFGADPSRAAREYVSWFRSGAYPQFWHGVAPALLQIEDATVAAEARALWAEARPNVQHVLAAAATRDGDQGARSWLLEQARAREPERRTLAIQVLAQIGDVPSLVDVLDGDPDGGLRALAANALVGQLQDPLAREALLLGLEDASPAVVEGCLVGLVAVGDPDAVDRALGMIGGSLGALELASHAFRGRLPEDSKLASRVLTRLRARHDAEAHLPLASRLGTLQCIGLVPSLESAEFLYELALDATDVQLDGLPARRWLYMQVANTGAAGRALLLSKLQGESDAIVRIDLLWSAATSRSDGELRAALLMLADDDSIDPYERLYIADRLVRMGPSGVVAPRLKRACLRIEEPRARTAFQCLLWRWY